MPKPRGHRIDVNPLLEWEYLALRQAMPERWGLFYDVLWYTGIRLAEGLVLRRGDLNEGSLRVRRSKRQDEKVEWIPLPPKLAEHLRLFMAGQRRQSLFARGNRERPYTEAAAQAALKVAALKAGVRPTVHPHLYRHGFGRRVAKLDLGLTAFDHRAILSKLLGLASTRHTETYFAPGPTEVEDAWRKLNS